MGKRKKEYPYIMNFKVEGINKASLEELSFRVSLNDKIKAVLCRQLTDDKVALFTYSFNKGSRILENGTFITHYIVDVLYTIVDEIRRFLIYDYIHNKAEYLNSKPDDTSNEAKIFGINYLPDSLLDKIAEEIFKKEETLGEERKAS